MKFNKEFGSFKAELAYLRPAKVVQFGFVLVKRKSWMGNTQIEMNSSVFLKGKYVLKNIKVND